MPITNPNNLCVNCMREKETSGICPYCGFDEAQYKPSPDHLPPRSILAGKYLTGRVLHQSAYSIVYLALDLNLDLKVAIKEYFPRGMHRACDDSSSFVEPGDKNDKDQFLKAKLHFFESAKRLVQHAPLPCIVSTRDTFLENATVYMTMECVEGESLHQYLEGHSGKVDAAAFLSWIRPLIGSLARLNADGILHLDINPREIIVTKDHSLKLVGFDMADVFGDFTSYGVPFCVHTKYSSVEQYVVGLVCGQWTDVYAISTTIYRAITGITPQSCFERENKDALLPPNQLGLHLSADEESALMRGLIVRPRARWQTMQQFYDALYQTPKSIITR